jgi:hypothetical protein
MKPADADGVLFGVSTGGIPDRERLTRWREYAEVAAPGKEAVEMRGV